MVLETFNPILEEKAYENKFFAEIPVPKAGTEIILYASCNQNILMITRERGIRPRDIHKGKYDRQVTVDTHKKTVSFRNEYRSADIGINFEITVKASVQVTEADIAWESGIHDIAKALENEMSAPISEEASFYESGSIREFQRDIRSHIGEQFLDGTGISIQGISYMIKLEKKHEEIIKNKYYEIRRSEAAQEISDLYRDNIVSIFAGVVDGSIPPEVATEKARESLSADFDERMRQLREITDYVEELRTKELVNNTQVVKQIENILSSLPFSGNEKQERLEAKDARKKLERKSYAPIDD